MAGDVDELTDFITITEDSILSTNNKIVTITPKGLLKAGLVYAVTIASATTSVDGNPEKARTVRYNKTTDSSTLNNNNIKVKDIAPILR